jgi:hypothetical protein
VVDKKDVAIDLKLPAEEKEGGNFQVSPTLLGNVLNLFKSRSATEGIPQGAATGGANAGLVALHLLKMAQKQPDFRSEFETKTADSGPYGFNPNPIDNSPQQPQIDPRVAKLTQFLEGVKKQTNGYTQKHYPKDDFASLAKKSLSGDLNDIQNLTDFTTNHIAEQIPVGVALAGASAFGGPALAGSLMGAYGMASQDMTDREQNPSMSEATHTKRNLVSGGIDGLTGGLSAGMTRAAITGGSMVDALPIVGKHIGKAVQPLFSALAKQIGGKSAKAVMGRALANTMGQGMDNAANQLMHMASDEHFQVIAYTVQQKVHAMAESVGIGMIAAPFISEPFKYIHALNQAREAVKATGNPSLYPSVEELAHIQAAVSDYRNGVPGSQKPENLYKEVDGKVVLLEVLATDMLNKKQFNPNSGDPTEGADHPLMLLGGHLNDALNRTLESAKNQTGSTPSGYDASKQGKKWYHGGSKGHSEIIDGMVTRNYEEAKRYADEAEGVVYELPESAVIVATNKSTGADGQSLGKNPENYGFIKPVKRGEKGHEAKIAQNPNTSKKEALGEINADNQTEQVKRSYDKEQITSAIGETTKEIRDIVEAETETLKELGKDIRGGEIIKGEKDDGQGGGSSYSRTSLPSILKHPKTGNKPTNDAQWKELAIHNLNRNQSSMNATKEYHDLINQKKFFIDRLAHMEKSNAIPESPPTETKPMTEQEKAWFDKKMKQGDAFDPPTDATHTKYDKFDTSGLKDISGTQAGFRDVFRNFEQVFGKEGYPEISHTLLLPFVEANGARVEMQTRWLDRLNADVVKGMGIKKGSKESAAVQEFGEGYIDKNGEKQKLTRDDLVHRFGEKKADNIIKADAWFRQAYNELIDSVNSSLRKVYPGRNEKLIPYRKDYYRHFREFSEFSGLLNIFETPANISPELAGTSQYTKPNEKLLGFRLPRFGNKTEVDAVGGFLSYVPSASYATHVTPFIKEFRNLKKWLVGKMDGDGKLNNFIEYLDDFANDLAGKTNPGDRVVQKWFPGGRRAMKVIDWFNNRTKANVILGNLRSMVAQSLNIPQSIGSAKQHSIKGALSVFMGALDKNSPINNSTFMKTRYAESAFDKFDRGILSHTRNFLKWGMTAVDEVSTKFIWYSHFEKGKADGVNDPMVYADNMTRKMVAGRSVGEVPLAQKSKIFQLIAPFQVEVGNLVWALGDMAKSKDIGGIMLFAVSSFVLNDLLKKLVKDRLSYDPIGAALEAYDKDESWATNMGKIVTAEAGEVLSNVTLGQSVAAVYPEFGFKFKVGDKEIKAPTRKEFFGKTDPTRFGGGLLLMRGLQDPLFKIIPPFGGNQLKKSWEAMDAFKAGYYKQGNKTVPVEQNMRNLLSGLAFGKYAFRSKDEKFVNDLEHAKNTAKKGERIEADLRAAKVNNTSIAVKNGKPIEDYLDGMDKTEKNAFVKSVHKKVNMASSDPITRALAGATTNRQKGSILREIYSRYNEDEFKEFLRTSVRKQLLSNDAAEFALIDYRRQKE